MGKRQFRLLEPFCYYGKGIRVELPAGSTTDFASIPRILWPILDPQGEYSWIAVVHDHCYRHGTHSREVSDAILLEGMRESGVPKWQMWAVYLAVRCFGWISYHKGE